jgi:3'-5' exoribonuclease
MVEQKKDHLWVKDIRNDQRVSGLYLVKVKRLGATKRGDPYLSITLVDRTGEIEARVWDRVQELSPLFREGDVVGVEGHAGLYQDQVQLTLSDLRPSAEPGDPHLFLECSTRDTAEMIASLRHLLKGIQDPPLKALVERFLADHPFVSLFKLAPAAKNFHHSYLGGLLEHTLSVCGLVGPVTAHYPRLNRDLLLAGAFLHDVGKVRELSFERRIDYTDEGRLLGHILLGLAMVDEKLAGLKGFPQETALRLKHLISSHHGEYAFGSPKRPKFLEAFALHLMDDLDAKMNGISRFMERDRQEGNWTDFSRLFERYFLKGIPGDPAEKAEDLPAEREKQRGLFSA